MLALQQKKNDNTHPLEVFLSTSNAPATPVESSLARELIFLQDHTTHHHAIISAQLKLLALPVDEKFGLATSTHCYNQQTLCAP